MLRKKKRKPETRPKANPPSPLKPTKCKNTPPTTQPIPHNTEITLYLYYNQSTKLYLYSQKQKKKIKIIKNQALFILQ
jgi:hypothetical protein